MKAFFRLNNSILDSGLTPNELKVAVCLYSCVFNNRCVVQIKQAAIAQKCGIKKIETVANIICQLQKKGIIERVSRPHKTNGWLGTYIYKLRAIVSKGYFKIKRYILGKLNGVQLRMYLFVCRAITKKNDMWNSFNDISRALQIGRHLIEGLWDGIKSMGSWLGDRCRDFGNAWVSGFKTIFGIHSPSTLFRDEIGKNLALGLAKAMDEEQKKRDEASLKAAEEAAGKLTERQNLALAAYNRLVNGRIEALNVESKAAQENADKQIAAIDAVMQKRRQEQEDEKRHLIDAKLQYQQMDELARMSLERRKQDILNEQANVSFERMMENQKGMISGTAAAIQNKNAQAIAGLQAAQTQAADRMAYLQGNQSYDQRVKNNSVTQNLTIVQNGMSDDQALRLLADRIKRDLGV